MGSPNESGAFSRVCGSVFAVGLVSNNIPSAGPSVQCRLSSLIKKGRSVNSGYYPLVMLLSVSEQRRKIRTGVIRTSKERTGKRLDQKNLLAEEGR